MNREEVKESIKKDYPDLNILKMGIISVNSRRKKLTNVTVLEKAASEQGCRCRIRRSMTPTPGLSVGLTGT